MTDGVRRLTHEEAEMLISARMDEQLDRADSRALLVHLQTCESCRAFAVQSEVLGRELAALPVLPPSAMVDRQVRESIARDSRRWSLASLFPGTAGNSGMRVALGAVAMLTLLSVFLLVRMAGNDGGSGGSIDAPSGGVAQQAAPSSTAELAMAESTSTAGPTETPRVVVQQTQEPTVADTVAAAQSEPTRTPQPDTGNPEQVAPTETLDPAYVYQADRPTQTPRGTEAAPTRTPQAPTSVPTEEGQVAVAAVLANDSSPVADGANAVSPEPADTSATQESELPSQAPEASTQPPVEETATATPTEPAPEPTMTETPVEISVDATESTEPAATQDAGQIVSVDESVTPGDAADTPAPDQAEGAPTEHPEEAPPSATEGPFVQPTIAPIGSESGNDQAKTPDTTPPIVPNDGSDVEAASSSESVGGDSPTIVPSGGGGGKPDQGPAAPDDGSTQGPVGGQSDTGGYGGQDGRGGGAQPSAIPTVDDSVSPSGLDLSTTVAELPAGTSSPVGRLEFSPGGDLYAVTAPDGQLAVANLDGELVVTLGPGDLPVWSGNAMMFSVPGENGTVVGIWNADSGDLSYIPPSEDEASSDLPIGGDGTTFYYLRTFPDRPGAMEVRTATVDGSDGGALWTSDETMLGGARPVWSSTGILLPTDSSWLAIDLDGNATELGENPYGFVGAPILSPGEGLVAYSAGDQVIVAWTDDPGTAVATSPYGGGDGGYAFATSGEEIVVSDGQALHVISYEGEDLGELEGNQPIGGVFWISDTIYYLQIGEDAALKSTSLDEIQSS